MNRENEEITPEQYKARLLKQNFANRCADYEDVIATLQTRVAILEQRLKQYEDTDTADAPVPPSNELAAPAPPVVPEE